MLVRSSAAAHAALVTAAVLGVLLTAGCSGDDSPAPTPSGSVAVAPAPLPSPTESLLPTPTATTSTVGGLADGFPTDLVAVPEGSEVLVSTVEADAATGLLDISLNLRSPLDTAALVEAIRSGLVAAGFTETVVDPTTSGLTATSTFVRGDDGAELLTLGVLDRDGVRTLTLGGSVRTGA
ncbi:MAG TPA: hypothetical protein VGC57_06440 [Cellulomonas sp.]